MMYYEDELEVERCSLVNTLASICEATVGRDPKDVQRFLNAHGMTDPWMTDQIVRNLP